MYGRAFASLAFLASFAIVSTGCAVTASHPDEEQSESNGTGDLPLGEIEGALTDWGQATTCKPIPKVAQLVDPEIVISLDGLTLHLRDRAGDYDRVFPIGPGAIDEKGKSKTPVGKFYTGSDTTQVKDGGWGYYYPCKVWWTDPDTNKKSPVFAGLPFIRLSGTPTAGYGIHGPIDSFTAPNGGTLRRGYVSHGCVRMSAADIVEVFGRIMLHPRTPVRIQREIERRSDGTAIDVATKWIGAECAADSDCTFGGGTCRLATGETRGTCTIACTRGCPDRAGEATTFCVPDPASGGGMCVPQSSTTFNQGCARYEGRLVAKSRVARPDRSAVADVCMPAR
jgi:hypothetical protein